MELVLLLGCGFVKFGTDSADPADTGVPGVDTAEPLCTAALDSGAPAGPDCYSRTLACGDSIEATTAGGQSRLVTDDYHHLFCFVDSDGRGYAGSERDYWVELAADQNAHLSVSAPCGEMSVAAMRWMDADTCPSAADPIALCEGDNGAGALSVTFGGYPSANTWLVVVDTATTEPLPFRLTLSCE